MGFGYSYPKEYFNILVNTMCSIVLAYKLVEGSDWLVGANRDEKLDRPAEGPRVREVGQSRILAPLDLEAGGTWIGINARGTLGALTNRFGSAPDPTRRSRGELVFEALQSVSARDGAARIAELPAAHYNPFHLVIAGADGAVVWSDGETMHREPLEPGLLVVTERSFGAAPNARADFIESSLKPCIECGEMSLEAMREVLAVRRDNDIDATSVYLPEFNYGTRSSILAKSAPDPKFFYADGAVPDAPYEDLSPMLREFLDG